MTELTFDRDQAEAAINRVKAKGLDWLYENYPKPNGQKRKSRTGFLMYQGQPYPVKPLGRLANEIAGNPMSNNPITNEFRRYFEGLGFELIENMTNEAKIATERQRKLASVWERPEQAKFRRVVFEKFGARCLISRCETLAVLEAAHIIPVSCGGRDEAWNGVPLRADLHRLFDAGIITIDVQSWTLQVDDTALRDYGEYNGIGIFSDTPKPERPATALNERVRLISEQQ